MDCNPAIQVQISNTGGNRHSAGRISLRFQTIIMHQAAQSLISLRAGGGKPVISH